MPLFCYVRVLMNRRMKVLGKYRLIGWREWISLPELGIDAIKVKVDSGARTSALHATQIRYLRQKDGSTLVSFQIPVKKNKNLRVCAPLVEKRRVKSSLGHETLRPVIRTQVMLGGQKWSTEVTLVNRDPMGFRMLLGRLAVKGKFLIHPSRGFIQSKAMRS